MIVKELIYNKDDNINKLVKCLEKDKKYLKNIPHQPGEFSAKPFKLTTTCKPNKKGDYYDYYKNSKQLATFENNMMTPFKDITILQKNNTKIKVINPVVSIWKNYKILKQEKCNSTVNKAINFILPGTTQWGPFLNHVFPYLYFSKSILDTDVNISILIKKTKFDSFEYIVRNVLKLKNKIIYVENNDTIFIKQFYMINLKGPFASGLFPYQAYCNVPIILYKNINKYIRTNFEDIKNRNILIYTKRNNNYNKTRHITNENKIINILKNYCDTNNLIFVNYEYKDYNIKKRFELFNKAKIVIGPHGSANHTVYFCNKNTIVIEFIFCKDCHNDATFSLAFDLDYWQIPVPEHGQYEKKITIQEHSIESLKEILNVI